MEYKQVTIYTSDESVRAVLIAELAEVEYEGFEETDDSLKAFINTLLFNEALIKASTEKFQLQYQVESIEQQNWNAQWESSFQPVIVQDFCTIRADFHQLDINTTHEIVITPKMSFGTGHHATTQLMIQMMKDISLAGCNVLDFGTGTGILAILAHKLGASHIAAIDNDEWSYTNTLENIERNNATIIKVQLGSLEIVQDQKFDIILANINRHILLHYMDQLYNSLQPGGKILMSGLLSEDKEIILKFANEAGLQLVKDDMLNNWIALLFTRH